MMNERLADFTTSELFRWVWSANKSHATDKDFVAWVESIDHNDPNHLDFCSNYLRWYSKVHTDEGMGADRDKGCLLERLAWQSGIYRLLGYLVWSLLYGDSLYGETL